MKLPDVINFIKLKYQENGVKLNPPASPVTIKQFENRIGFDLPTDFKDFYSICNGFECQEDYERFKPV